MMYTDVDLVVFKPFVINNTTATRLAKEKVFNKTGFSLLEIVIVLITMAILVAIVIPSFFGYIEKTRKTVCDINCAQLERAYERFVVLYNIDYSETVFTQYIKEFGEDICPSNGHISYLDGKVRCSVHSRGDGSEDDDNDDGSVPFL